MDQDKDFYSGYLLFPSQGKIILRKAWHQKYCLLYKMSKFGIERLEFFGSSSKLSNIQPGYKQVSPAAPAQPTTYAPSWNDYDEVETNMQAVRLADDSHLGYGVIRKSTPQKQTLDQGKVSHQVYNDTAYAVVSKPKRV
ncbi:Downstream of kinase [Carabus blaptoides fortunei]